MVQLLARRVSFNATNGATGRRGGRRSADAALLPLLQRTQRITGPRYRAGKRWRRWRSLPAQPLDLLLGTFVPLLQLLQVA